ncbi:GAF domain-containing protein [Verminephrobacter aporrectodeae subsp. tuberculatae]|uniref:GAF domain-containing protein n=1 Tax=Verminephrobacter aporrectodeae TaxID=1110389 RepID=UPI0002376C3D|nr:GAF domain-containing protein [Verminephrobacter aporrectodeae]MCW8167061.1 GAF domain-containing protein [Verminephrobacter aporrectodeae subsp. tuberculatae]MCW8171252.1 GAF domain-containing protein [Verminephrobacter aporrectodeae subsp. tuberculatae]MCW8197103.1 GAF domain-containing protein [Verminephrobacter aporrectodeae subsp. tuberculatae]MCW8206307.1 GAF domain-containing protein [Verminephrobacter aporrectodeae subsp. tuberculatae]
MADPENPMLRQLADVARAHDDACQPRASFEAIDRAAAALIGHRLFTILVHHRAEQASQRIYSNMPEAYPVKGRKPITDTPWMRRVMVQGLPYIGRNADDIREVFFDHALILSLGCQSVLNMPLRWQGQTLGTLNLLHQQDWYAPHHVEMASVLAQLAIVAILANPL